MHNLHIYLAMITTHNFIFIFIFIFIFVLILSLIHSGDANDCIPSACGAIRNISSPFRLNTDPSHCGDPKFELTCENNVTFLYQKNSVKYYVKSINYQKSTIRFVDASIDSDDICSFPTISAHAPDFIAPPQSVYPYFYHVPLLARFVNLIICPNPLNNSTSLFIDITQHCPSNLSRPGFSYVKLGRIMASEVPRACGLDLVVLTSWPGLMDSNNNVSTLHQIHQSFLYGFELFFCSWCGDVSTTWEKLWKFFLGYILYIPVPLAMLGVSLPVMIIIGITSLLLLSFTSFWDKIQYYYLVSLGFNDIFSGIAVINVNIMVILAPRIIICPLVFWLFIYKFRRRRLSLFEGVESFLQSDNKLVPVRYSYSNIKKMTKNFEDKLGQGGFGSVYKGKLRSGHLVAVKLLGKSGANGQDFINEIATIGRIHHVNVVQLVGYCAEGSKRALIFDFMSNGSLDKYVFNPKKASSLDWDMKFKIAIEVARGMEYLHHGCDNQILHFDIKPHNILLDDKFVPKISDFGLAKLCAANKEAVTLTAARGTIGYVAPELINRSIGAVSYKADVYSFGMLLMEMVNLNKDVTKNDEESSKYFPNWIYDHLNQGRDIDIGNVYENDDRNIGRKMAIVALWCIQMSPDNRPSMNKVLEMLESADEHLEIPNYLASMTGNEEENSAIDSNASISLSLDNNENHIIEIISNA